MTKETFHQLLFVWWREQGRVLPWREKVSFQISGFRNQQQKSRDVAEGASLSVRDTIFQEYFAEELQRDPYRVIVSEVMLQQTQVERVKQKYEAWMRKWPTVEDLAKETLAEVLIEWQGLGYNRRARFLWLLAKEIVEQRKGVWPQDEKELLKLPGIGRYTARAVMSFGFGKYVGVVDVNVKRVFGRWFNVNFQMTNDKLQINSKSQIRNSKQIQHSEIKNSTLKIRQLGLQEIKSEKDWFMLADKLLPTNADPWNQALMDFGALMCTARKPKCEECPMAEVCAVNVRARELGFESFRELLDSRTVGLGGGEIGESENWRIGKTGKKGKDFGLKFEETDRFFRGRIMDALREKEFMNGELFELLNTEFNLKDKARFKKIVAGLVKEGMIEKKGEVVRLAT